MHIPGKSSRLILLVVGLLGTFIFCLPQAAVLAQQIDEPTPSPTDTSSGVTITVTYSEPINVRSGPSSVDYPVIGTLDVGATARAIGRSPAGEWILIVAPEGVDWEAGTGWVYADLVSLPPGFFLPIVEPPPTPMPLMTDTPNPTFVAAFRTEATSTRLPTFTQAPPLVVPSFQNEADPSVGGVPIGLVILLLGLLGLVGLVAASTRGR